MCKLLNEKSLLFAALLLSAVSMSCSKDPDETDKPNKPDDHNIIEWGDSTLSGDATMGEMKFNISNGISVRRSLTRGYNSADGTSYTLEKDDIVTIEMSSALQSTATKNYLASATGDATAGGSGIALTYAGTDGFYWKSQSEEVNIRAWSYGDGSTSTANPDGQTFTLPQDQSSGYQELLYSPLQTNIPYTTGHSGISLTMYHQLARIVVSIEYDNGISSLNSITIGDGSATIPRTATFTKPVSPGYYGTWSGFGSQTDPITPKTETANTCYSAVLIPTTYAAGTKLFVITIGSEPFAYKLDAALNMEVGKQYNYSLKVKNKALVVSGCTITDWGSGTSGGTVTISTLP